MYHLGITEFSLESETCISAWLHIMFSPSVCGPHLVQTHETAGPVQSLMQTKDPCDRCAGDWLQCGERCRERGHAHPHPFAQLCGGLQTGDCVKAQTLSPLCSSDATFSLLYTMAPLFKSFLTNSTGPLGVLALRVKRTSFRVCQPTQG